MAVAFGFGAAEGGGMDGSFYFSIKVRNVPQRGFRMLLARGNSNLNLRKSPPDRRKIFLSTTTTRRQTDERSRRSNLEDTSTMKIKM
jgi:hypothetical protein